MKYLTLILGRILTLPPMANRSERSVYAASTGVHRPSWWSGASAVIPMLKRAEARAPQQERGVYAASTDDRQPSPPGCASAVIWTLKRAEARAPGAVASCALILMLAAGAWPAGAQTNAPDERTRIYSDGPGSFDMVRHHLVYQDNVRVDNPEMKLTCAWLAADLPRPGNPDKHILARTNVVMDLTGEPGKGTNGGAGLLDDTHQNWHVTSDQAEYDFHVAGTATNETVTATGHAVAKSDKMTITSEREPLVYNLVTKLFSGKGYDTIINNDALNPGRTNAAAITNQAPTPR